MRRGDPSRLEMWFLNLRSKSDVAWLSGLVGKVDGDDLIRASSVLLSPVGPSWPLGWVKPQLQSQSQSQLHVVVEIQARLIAIGYGGG